MQFGRGNTRAVRRDSTTQVDRLDIPDSKLSSVHASISIVHGEVWMQDLGSTNGTWVNGAALERLTRVALDDGDFIEAGQTLFLFRWLVVDVPRVTGDLIVDATQSTSALSTLDPAFAREIAQIEKIASTPLSVLIRGETGTGKELVARAIHEISRRPGPFVALNCGAIPPNLVESHLFGHVRGAFSGATKDEVGVVRAAQHGTLLLDEIGDLPLLSQTALLRLLQEHEVTPVGASRPIKVDVRVIAATHQPLDTLVESGRFRQDLYARIAGYVTQLAPLRERIMDLGVIIGSMIARRTVSLPEGVRFHRETTRALFSYRWPMNIRELSQALSAASALSSSPVIMPQQLPAWVVASQTESSSLPVNAELNPADEALKSELLARLNETGGNLSEVARLMGKARQQVQRWLRRFHIDPQQYRR